jgi:hypothetical protein
MSIEIYKPQPSSFFARLGKAFANILRFILILVVISAIGIGVYFGIPYFYQRIIVPIETNTARLTEVEQKQSLEISKLSSQITDLKSRLAVLETRQTQNASMLVEQQGKLKSVEAAIEKHNASLNQLNTIQNTIENLAVAVQLHETLLVGENSSLVNLQRQITMSRSIELLSRARLYLSQSNFGLARQDIQKARDLLINLQIEIPENKAAAMANAIIRLDLALANLPAFPVVAVDDLDIAWQFLINDLAGEPLPSLVQETPSPSPTPTYSPTPVP